MKHLLALLLLTAPAYAGGYIVTSSDGFVPLDTPPPGATSLRVRYAYSDCTMNSGVEHFGSGATVTTQIKHMLSLEYLGTEYVAERFIGTERTTTLTDFDGVFDYAGTSGASWQDVRSKGTTAWATINALPTSLDVSRRSLYTVLGASPSNGAYSISATAFVEWEWL